MTPTKHFEEKRASLEAILFVHGEPILKDKVAKLLDLTHDEIQEVIEGLKQELKEVRRGLALVENGDRIQLVTKSDLAPLLERFVKEELHEELTPASLETLALISYLGPLSRARLEFLRGVNSNFILRSLLMRGLVDRESNPQQPSSYHYRASFKLLHHLGVTRQEELPDYDQMKSVLEAYGKEA